jgi:16S rRNA (uracil1498-N3)-methyltransferase
VLIMHRFYLEVPIDELPSVGQHVTLDPAESRHLSTVLRTEPGTPLTLTDGRGHALEAVLDDSDRRRSIVRITAVRRAEEEVALPRLHLACAVVKGRRFEVALEKSVELGVHVVTPLRTGRGVVDPGGGKQERWRSLLVSALKQSDRCYLPQLARPADLTAVLSEADADDAEIWYGAAPIESPDTPPLTLLQAADLVASRRREGAGVPPELLLLIGPEGGWTDDEIATLARSGARPLTLGPHVLRTETAAMAGLTVLQQLRSVWRS